MWLGWLSVGWAAAACEDRLGLDVLVEALSAAEVAYTELNEDGFHDAEAQIAATLPCIVDLVTPSIAARMHRIAGLGARMDERVDDARISFAAARTLDPRFRYPAESPVAADYLAIPLTVGRTIPVPAPLDGAIYFDGRASLERPAVWPTLVQILDESGNMATTVLLWPDEPMPAYPTAPVEASTSDKKRAGSTSGKTSGKQGERAGISPGTIGWIAESIVAAGIGVAMYSTASNDWAEARCQTGAADAVSADLCNSVRERYVWGTALMAAGGAGLVGAGVVAVVSGSW